MSGEVIMYIDGTDNYTLQVEEADWDISYGISSFSPAVLRVLGTVFGGETIPNFIIYFGKFSETVTFSVSFASDTEWKAFRKFATQTAYFNTNLSSKPLQFYWGGSGDPFYTGENDVAQLDNYEGLISKIKVSRKFPGKNWRGIVQFKIGEVIQA